MTFVIIARFSAAYKDGRNPDLAQLVFKMPLPLYDGPLKDEMVLGENDVPVPVLQRR